MATAALSRREKKTIFLSSWATILVPIIKPKYSQTSSNSTPRISMIDFNHWVDPIEISRTWTYLVLASTQPHFTKKSKKRLVHEISGTAAKYDPNIPTLIQL